MKEVLRFFDWISLAFVSEWVHGLEVSSDPIENKLVHTGRCVFGSVMAGAVDSGECEIALEFLEETGGLTHINIIMILLP